MVKGLEVDGDVAFILKKPSTEVSLITMHQDMRKCFTSRGSTTVIFGGKEKTNFFNHGI